MQQRLRQGALHIAAGEPDILQHAIIELGEVPDLSTILQRIDETCERSDELPQGRHA